MYEWYQFGNATSAWVGEFVLFTSSKGNDRVDPWGPCLFIIMVNVEWNFLKMEKGLFVMFQYLIEIFLLQTFSFSTCFHDTKRTADYLVSLQMCFMKI